MKATLAAAATALLANRASAYFILQSPTLAIDRQDAIISPGVNVVASHVHNLVGGSSINSNSSYDSLMNSKCTSVPVTVDKSAYWQPNLYYYDPLEQTYQSIPSYSKIYYLQRPGPLNQTLVAFPPGFRMVAGNPNRKTYNASSFADQAISYVCQDYSGTHQTDPEWFDRGNFFNHNCPDGMRAEVVFPSCWNGQDLYKTDNSHVAYPIQAVNTGDCPDTHPVHLITLFQEFVYDVASFPFNGNGTVTWILANGDTTGYGLHADALLAWPTDILQAAIDQCAGEIGGDLENCPPLAPYLDTDAGNACKIESDLVDEDVGIGHPISKLPGCNTPWSSGAKPSCPPESTPGFISSKSVPAAGYSYYGCLAEPSGGRLLTGATVTTSNMTAAVCTAFCTQGGFEWSGTEYSSQCYCGSTLSNGGTNATISESHCSMTCSGNPNEDCGGPSTLSVFQNPSLAVASAPALPSGWRSLGCVVDGVNSTRTLSSYSYTSADMTISSCVSTCSDKGYSYAGVEYSAECYCSNAPTTLQSSTSCGMSCSGDPRYTCGGPNALTMFSSALPATNGYASVGCVAEGTTGRLLTGASLVADDMTPEICTAFCGQSKFLYSGQEYGRECYCGSSFNNGGDGSLLASSECSMACAGDSDQKCGAGNILSLYKNTDYAPAPTVLPSGWSNIGCLVDNFNATRTLGSYSFTSGSMTYALCTNKCQGLGYSYAGVEYSDECYCSDTLSYNATSTECSMPCSGAEASANCGGPNALTAFEFMSVSTRKRQVKLRANRRSVGKKHGSLL